MSKPDWEQSSKPDWEQSSKPDWEQSSKPDFDVNKKTQTNLLHEYHKVIDPLTGKIDITEWKTCKCEYCSVWTQEVLESYDQFLKEEAMIKQLYSVRHEDNCN